MLELLAAMMAHTVSGPPSPSIVSVVPASTNAGTCGATGIHIPTHAASYAVTVTVANVDFTLYKVNLYENNVLKATFTSSPLVYNVTVTGNVEDGPVSPFTINRTYRADLVALSGGSVVDSKSGNWTQDYGQCP